MKVLGLCTRQIEGKELYFVGYNFIDDTDIIQSGQPGEPFQLLATHTQAAMDTWEGGLRATGGALEPEKSFWYLIRFSGRTDSGYMFQKKTHMHQSQYVSCRR
jgi:hypothetical protein